MASEESGEGRGKQREREREERSNLLIILPTLDGLVA